MVVVCLIAMKEQQLKKLVREGVAVVDPEVEEDHRFQEAVRFVIIVIKKGITHVNVEKKDLIEDLVEMEEQILELLMEDVSYAMNEVIKRQIALKDVVMEVDEVVLKDMIEDVQDHLIQEVVQEEDQEVFPVHLLEDPNTQKKRKCK